MNVARPLITLGLLAALAACGGAAERFTVRAPAVTEKTSIAFSSVEVRDVSRRLEPRGDGDVPRKDAAQGLLRGQIRVSHSNHVCHQAGAAVVSPSQGSRHLRREVSQRGGRRTRRFVQQDETLFLSVLSSLVVVVVVDVQVHHLV